MPPPIYPESLTSALFGLGNWSAPALGDQFFRLDDRMGCVGGTLPITIDEDFEVFVRRDLLFHT